MKYTFVDYPRPVEPAAYGRAIRAACLRLRRVPGIRSIYQIGGVSTPGISDLDLVVVVEDGIRVGIDPLADCTADERYLFVHPLFGVSSGLFQEVLANSAFHDYRLVDGTPIPGLDLVEGLTPANDGLKEQIALEFMLRMLVNTSVQQAYRVVKLRGFLLQAKAIRYDLDFLGVSDGKLAGITDEIIGVRSHWFERPADESTLNRLVTEFHDALLDFLLDALAGAHSLYLPEDRRYQLAPHFSLVPHPVLEVQHRGFVLPSMMARLSAKAISLQNRFNWFELRVPARTTGVPGPLRRRFALNARLREYNRAFLPNFGTLTSSLNV